MCISLFSNTNKLRTMKESMVINDNGFLRLSMNTLRNNDTYDLIPMPNGWKPIRYKCFLKNESFI